eukprot:3386037-Pleurochrysis_carterae.AAC.2
MATQSRAHDPMLFLSASRAILQLRRKNRIHADSASIHPERQFQPPKASTFLLPTEWTVLTAACVSPAPAQVAVARVRIRLACVDSVLTPHLATLARVEAWGDERRDADNIGARSGCYAETADGCVCGGNVVVRDAGTCGACGACGACGGGGGGGGRSGGGGGGGVARTEPCSSTAARR